MSINNKIKNCCYWSYWIHRIRSCLFLSKHPKVKNKIILCATKNLGKKLSFFDKRIKKKLPKISSIKKY